MTAEAHPPPAATHPDAVGRSAILTLAVAPALDIASNLFLGRERRRSGLLGTVLRMVDKKGMRAAAGKARARSAASAATDGPREQAGVVADRRDPPHFVIHGPNRRG